MSDHIKAREGETIANGFNKIYWVQIVIQFMKSTISGAGQAQLSRLGATPA